ncbi:hypothetical protein ATY78_24595 [Rhizobium sp. R635]|uniref:hypothetical protein n=1 Tax=Rhizobium sp. R635 TaxID=1764275 RepID=UPI000B529A83|nr:hypothetical protein [Rhizobium sp. R635]OWV85865.1 hypothetical protein ATY78_24595 [Rhizobium sp. R635]
MLKNQDDTRLKGGRLRLAVCVWGTVLLALGPMSCSAVDDDVAVIAKKKIVAAEAPRVTKAYAYPASRADRPAAATVGVVSYHGSAPYICSPSGFGQKSRCFARPST